MLKILDFIVNKVSWLLSFILVLSTFFNIISWTSIDLVLHSNEEILILVWIISLLIAGWITPHLFRWVIHWRSLLQRFLQQVHLR